MSGSFGEKSGPRVRVEGKSSWLNRGDSTGFHLVEVEFPVAGLARGLEGFRFLHLTDVHLRAFWPAVLDGALPAAMGKNPQMVLFTGDFVDSKKRPEPAYPFVHRFLDAVRTPLGTFAITGNHDGRAFLSRFSHPGTVFLQNTRAVVSVGGSEIELIGLTGPNRRITTRNTLGTFPTREAGTAAGGVRIVMDHYPDHVRIVGPALKPDLMLAGHTHGGQVCLPGGWPIITHDALPRRMAAGLHWTHGTWLNVSRGLGFSQWQVRTFCPIEVHVITLVRG